MPMAKKKKEETKKERGKTRKGEEEKRCKREKNLWGHICVHETRAQVALKFQLLDHGALIPNEWRHSCRVAPNGRLRSWPKTGLWWSLPSGYGLSWPMQSLLHWLGERRLAGMH